MVGLGTDALVEKAFWEEEYYWAHVEPPCRPDMELPFDRSMARVLGEVAPAQPGERVLEVGCAPAKWLGYYGERFGAYVEGIEYSEKGARLSQENLSALGVRGRIRHADFFQTELESYDLVLSFGFIEHFEDIEGVFARHLDFLRPGGRLALGVPNFRGVNGLLQRWGSRPYLDLHNVKAMDAALYRRLGSRHGLEVLDQRYVGGPDPIIVKSQRAWVTALVLAEARFRRLAIAERLDSRWTSPYLLTVFRTPGPTSSS